MYKSKKFLKHVQKKNLIKFKKLIICINPTLTLIKNLTQVTLFLAWITGMDLATSSGLLLTTSEDGYVRQGGEVILYNIYIPCFDSSF